MLLNKQISLAFVATYAGWVLAIAVWIISWVVNSPHLGHGAIIIALIAAVTTSRLAAREQAREVHNALTIVHGVETVTPLPRR